MSYNSYIKYGIIGACCMAICSFAVVLIKCLILNKNTISDEVVEFYPIFIFWVILGIVIGIVFRKQYLQYVSNFTATHKELPIDMATKFARENFKSHIAGQFFPVVALFPLAYFSFDRDLPNSIGDIIFIIVIELIALWLYLIKKKSK